MFSIIELIFKKGEIMKKVTVILVSILLWGFLSNVSGGEKKRKKSSRIKLTDLSTMKKFNSNTVWRKAICKHCNGTGHKIQSKYDAKNNRMIKWFIPCHYCKGRGNRGMTKK